MKINELSDAQILDAIGVSEDSANFLGICKSAALNFIKGATALTEEEINSHEDLTIAYICTIGDMFENRSATVQGGKPNSTVEQIIALYRKNYL